MASHKQHFMALEWLRLCLGLYIVLFHTFHFPELPDWVAKLTQLGFFSTSTFFVLSGFLLAHVYLKRNADNSVYMRESRKSFLIKRFANLYPIHLFSLVATLVIVSALPHLMIIPNDAGASMRFVMYDANNYADGSALKHYMSNAELALAFVMNGTLLQALNPYYLTFNAPAWTVSTLFCLYLIFPFFAIRLSKLKKPLIAIGLLNLIYLVPVLLAIQFSDFGMPITGILHRNPLIRLPEFAAGILLCSLYHRQCASGFRPSKIVISALVFLILGSLYGASRFLAIAPQISSTGNVPYYLLHDGLLLPAQLSLIYLCLYIRLPETPGWLKWSKRFGGASLPMFAFHVPLYMVFSRIERVITGEPSLCWTSLHQCFVSSGQPVAWLYPVFIVLLIGFCILFQERVVISCRNWIQRVALK
ncbi:acyltransferase family protein [Pseudomonas luteola]